VSFKLAGLRKDVVRRPEWCAASELAKSLIHSLPARAANDARKFLYLDYWLDINLERAANLGLHQQKGLRTVDLGCGSGLFAFVCNVGGHKAMGTDLPLLDTESPEREVYKALTLAFRIQVQRARILAFRPLPVPRECDLITSFMICFNNHKQPDEWGVREWKYFVNDALDHLRPGGRLVLTLNGNPEKFGALEFFDAETKRYFETIGTVASGTVVITNCVEGQTIPANKLGPAKDFGRQ
jgi:SAM-dependent methyltransferase